MDTSNELWDFPEIFKRPQPPAPKPIALPKTTVKRLLHSVELIGPNNVHVNAKYYECVTAGQVVGHLLIDDATGQIINDISKYLVITR